MSKAPELAITIKAFCSCSDRETTWTVIREKYGTYRPAYPGPNHNIYSYIWSCLNCGKKRNIGLYYHNGEPYDG